MARTKAETDELILALMEWAEADPDAALVVAAVNDGTHDTGSLITLGHAGCSLVSTMATVAELLDVAEETVLAHPNPQKDQWRLKRIHEVRAALGTGKAEVVQ